MTKARPPGTAGPEPQVSPHELAKRPKEKKPLKTSGPKAKKTNKLLENNEKFITHPPSHAQVLSRAELVFQGVPQQGVPQGDEGFILLKIG